MIKSIYDIQQYIKQFGAIIYIGDRVLDLELMEMEVRELYKAQLMEIRDYQTAILLLRQEIRLTKEKQNKQ